MTNRIITKLKNRPYESVESAQDDHTLENILDEYKKISLKLFELSDCVVNSIEDGDMMAAEQSRLLDQQSNLLCEAETITPKNDKDAYVLMKLWCDDEIYGEEITAAQNLLLKVKNYLGLRAV